jgi:hypothetical protein
METKDRLERVATVLTATADSPSPGLREMGLRLLANKMRDLACAVEAGELREMEEFHTPGPPQCPVSRICDELAERVRRIMGGE